MCLHTTHLLFSCGHHLELSKSGKEYIKPVYCDRVKQELEWYHSQPKRTPEPVPYPAPRPCPLVCGTQAFTGNMLVKPQKSPCPSCVSLHGLAGINAIESERAKQEENSPKRKKRLSKGKRTDKVWIWRPISGEDWVGLEKVLVDATEAAKISQASTTPEKEKTQPAEQEATLSPASSFQVIYVHPSPPVPANIPSAALPPAFEPQTAAQTFAYLEEAGRRGMEMYTNFADPRLVMPQGAVPPEALMAPSSNVVSYPTMTMYPTPPLTEPAPAFYPHWTPHQGYGYEVTYPPNLPYGVVQQVGAPNPADTGVTVSPTQPTIQLVTPSSSSAHEKSSVEHRTQDPHNDTESQPPARRLSEVFDALQEQTRRMSIRSEQSPRAPASPLVVDPRPSSACEDPKSLW